MFIMVALKSLLGNINTSVIPVLEFVVICHVMRSSLLWNLGILSIMRL